MKQSYLLKSSPLLVDHIIRGNIYLGMFKFNLIKRVIII